MFSCQICEIFKNTYLEEHLRTTASKRRSSFPEVFYRNYRSALINAVMKYSFSAAVVESWRVFHGNLLKIALHHRYFSKDFTAVAERRYWKMYLDGCFWGRIYFWNIPAWLLLKSSCRRIFVLEILKRRIHCEIFLSGHFMKYSFRIISWNMKYFHEILLLQYPKFIA